MLVGKVKSEVTFSTVRLLSLIVGPSGEG